MSIDLKEKLSWLRKNISALVTQHPELHRADRAELLATLHTVINQLRSTLVPDPCVGPSGESRLAGSDPCPHCDHDRDACLRGGRCEEATNEGKHPEPWEFRLIAFPRDVAVIVDAAIERARQISDRDQRHSTSKLLGLICLDFLATHGWGHGTRGLGEQRLRCLAETFEQVMGLRLAVFAKDGTLLYGTRTLEVAAPKLDAELARLAGAEPAGVPHEGMEGIDAALAVLDPSGRATDVPAAGGPARVGQSKFSSLSGTRQRAAG
jgi:hypothetical protein